MDNRPLTLSSPRVCGLVDRVDIGNADCSLSAIRDRVILTQFAPHED